MLKCQLCDNTGIMLEERVSRSGGQACPCGAPHNPTGLTALQLLNSMCCAVEQACQQDVFTARMHIVCGVSREFLNEALKTPPLLSEQISCYELDGKGSDLITLERRSRNQDGWAIVRLGFVFNTFGEWEWEPMPSGRSEDFLQRTRWNSAQEAKEAFERLKEKRSDVSESSSSSSGSQTS